MYAIRSYYDIGNFTFLVGVAAAAIMLVIPAYIYNWKPLKEIVILGELLAISRITSYNVCYTKLLRYTVQGGDTLSDIALRFGVTVESIQELNNLDTTMIYVGQILQIPRQ